MLRITAEKAKAQRNPAAMREHEQIFGQAPAQTSNYALTGPRLRGVHPSAATVLAGDSPTGVQEVVLSLPGGRRNRGQIRGVSISGTNQGNNAGTAAGSGITDNAGNPLQGFSQGLLSFARARTVGKRKRG